MSTIFGDVLGSIADGQPVAEPFAGHKIVPPSIPSPSPSLTRERLVEAVDDKPIVLITGPYGYGKSTLAQQIARGGDGPIAWYTGDSTDTDSGTVVGYVLRALARAWPDVESYLHATEAEDVACSRLAYVLEELGGPSTFVLDDVHAVPEAVMGPVLDTIVRARPDGMRLVLCGRTVPPLDVLKLEAEDVIARVTAQELALTETEVSQLVGGDGGHLHVATRGWPLAVRLALARSDAKEARLRNDDMRSLGRRLLADVDRHHLDALALASILPRVPMNSIAGLVGRSTASGVRALGDELPALVTVTEDDWLLVHDLGRECFQAPCPEERVRLVRQLDADGHRDLAVEAALRSELWDHAAELAERDVAGLLRTRRLRRVRDVVEALPPSHRAPILRLGAAQAGAALREISSADLEELRAEMWTVGEAEGLRASVILANHLLALGESRAFHTAMDALGRICQGSVDEDSLTELVAGLDPAIAQDVGQCIVVLAISLLFTACADDRALAGRLADLADRALTVGGGDPEVAAAVFAAIDAAIGGTDPAEALALVEPAAHKTRASDDPVRGWLLVALVYLELRVRGLGAARRVCDELVEYASETGYDSLALKARHVELLLDICTDPSRVEAAEVRDGAESVWEEVREVGTNASEFAVQLGEVLADVGCVDEAWTWLERARRGPHVHPYLLWDIQDLDARLRWLDSGDVGALEALEAGVLRREQAGLRYGAGRLRARVLMDLNRRNAHDLLRRYRRLWNDEIPGAWRRTIEHDLSSGPVDTGARPRLEIFMLGPETRVAAAGETRPRPKGIAARLLAILVAAGGTIEQDRAIEEIWPGIDPEAGRKRLYCAVHRLRRSLGVGVDGPVKTERNTLLRLENDGAVVVDVWEFEAAEDAAEAVALYTGEFLHTQFAYDDFAIEARRALHARFVTLATRFARAASCRRPSEQDVETVRTCHRLAPDDEDVCLAAVEVLVVAGRNREAAAVIDETVALIEDLGLPTRDLRRRAAVLLRVA